MTQGQKNQRERSRKAQKILDDNYEKGEHYTNIVDMLTDLRHMCDVKRVQFYRAVGSSYRHYLAEKRGEPI